jgi:hypothetical protein
MTRLRPPPARRCAAHAVPAASVADSSMLAKLTPNRLNASFAATSLGKAAVTSAHTTSQATSPP